MNSSLAKFENPPVVEVALAVQFDRLNLSAPALANYRDIIRDEFPHWRVAAVRSTVVERFGASLPTKPRLRIDFLDEAPPARSLFESEARDALIQVQTDSFVTNWLKRGDPYPHYDDVIRPQFEQRLREFAKFLADHRLGELRPNQWEVTYVNDIAHDLGADLGDILKTCRAADISGLDAPEWTEYSAHYRIPDSDGNPIGRLHVVASTSGESSTERTSRLTLTSRGHPRDISIEAVLEGLDLGRRKAVGTFKEIITEQMHARWGLR